MQHYTHQLRLDLVLDNDPVIGNSNLAQYF